jgi:predicted nucleic acid-binding protein
VAELFLDASYAIALASASDRHHGQAQTLAREIESDPTIRLVTTRAVLLEIGNALARQRYRSIAVQLLNSLENDSTVAIIPLSETLCAAAMQLFQARADKEWGLTDCVSFVVMQERAITDALTADAHFQQAGFRPLLLGSTREIHFK